MHGERRLCTVFSVLRQLSHRKAALALPLRAGSHQLSVKYGDIYASGGGFQAELRTEEDVWVLFFFSGFRWIISSKSSVNISVAS